MSNQCLVVAEDTECQRVFWTGSSWSHEYPDAQIYGELVADALVEQMENDPKFEYAELRAIYTYDYE